MFGMALPAGAQTQGSSCSVNGRTAPGTVGAGGNNLICVSGLWQYVPYQFGSSSASCSSTNAGAVQWTGSVLEFCNGSSWGPMPYTVASAYGLSMVPSWPDGILCNATSPALGTTIFYAAQMPYSSDGLYHYRYRSGSTNYDLEFTSAGAFSAYANLTTTNCNASIATLYGNNQAFNFVKSTQSAAYNPPANAATGYFVMTGTTWNGNLGELAGANTLCHTELTSTHTGWMGYSTASALGYLTTANITAALLCDYRGSCNEGLPLTTYYFANTTSSAIGGASFTTLGDGSGPNDSGSNWSGSTFFGGSYTYWSGEANGNQTNTNWGSMDNTNSCINASTGLNWSTSSSSVSIEGTVGISNSTNSSRWGNATPKCNVAEHLICFVHPYP
jgi:hypothetical protein